MFRIRHIHLSLFCCTSIAMGAALLTGCSDKKLAEDMLSKAQADSSVDANAIAEADGTESSPISTDAQGRVCLTVNDKLLAFGKEKLAAFAAKAMATDTASETDTGVNNTTEEATHTGMDGSTTVCLTQEEIAALKGRFQNHMGANIPPQADGGMLMGGCVLEGFQDKMLKNGGMRIVKRGEGFGGQGFGSDGGVNLPPDEMPAGNPAFTQGPPPPFGGPCGGIMTDGGGEPSFSNEGRHHHRKHGFRGPRNVLINIGQINIGGSGDDHFNEIGDGDRISSHREKHRDSNGRDARPIFVILHPGERVVDADGNTVAEGDDDDGDGASDEEDIDDTDSTAGDGDGDVPTSDTSADNNDSEDDATGDSDAADETTTPADAGDSSDDVGELPEN